MEVDVHDGLGGGPAGRVDQVHALRLQDRPESFGHPLRRAEQHTPGRVVQLPDISDMGFRNDQRMTDRSGRQREEPHDLAGLEHNPGGFVVCGDPAEAAICHGLPI